MNQEQFIIRSYSPAQDNPRLLSLYAAVEAVDHIGLNADEQVLRTQLEFPGHDPLKDRWVVEAPDDPNALVASALVHLSPRSRTADANIIVHPAWRCLGIGSKLLSRVISRTSESNSSVVQIYANTKHPASRDFLQKHGFIFQGAYTEFRLVEGIRLPPVIWPFGYTMRTYSEIQDPSIFAQAMNQGYILLWGHDELSAEEVASWLPDLNQHGLFLVFSEKGRVVGISRAELSLERTSKNGRPTGYIDAPGVVPQHRRLDLYRALVLTGIHWLHSQGQSIVEMESWGDKLEVLKMYRELGFIDLRQLACYQATLPAEGNLQPTASP